jgi:serine/threonine protein kinase
MLKNIGKYILKDKIDKNELEICYKAIDNNNKLYAIKKINIQNKKYVDNEIKILKKINYKYSIKFIELIEENDYIYLVLELCDCNLNDLIKKKNGNLDKTTIFEIIFQLNEVLKLMNSKK